ncbi:MAG: sensor histidine kinase [Dorea sp.]|nr:sensor histidine kinase [Dorea sp.]
MRPVGRLRCVICLECAYMTLVYVLYNVLGDGVFLAVVCILMQTLIIAGMYFFILYPLKTFEEMLAYFLDEERTEAELDNASDAIPYSGEIKALVDRYLSRKTRKNSAEIFDKQTELTALQSQINPHFLYNTLESIRGQALMDDNREIAGMVEALSSFFRYSISRKGKLVTLREELANINNYMLIQCYRFNNRFSLEVLIDEEDEEAYDFLIPKLIIQPVVENAIYHGLEEKLEGGRVTIEVIVTDKTLILTISDNGSGIEGAALAKLNQRIHSPSMRVEEEGGQKQHNTGIALPNIHKRIQLLFGEEYGVNVYSTVGQGTDVEITIPADYS